MKPLRKLFVVAILLTLSTTIKAGDVNLVGDIWYDIDISSKTASVVAPNNGGKYSGEISIPSTINFDGTVRVTAIGARAFYGCVLLTKVTMTSQITSIGENAFNGCTALEEVSGYTNVTTIGQYAFSGCSKLTEFHIYSALTTVGKSAFYNCTGLQAVYAHNLDTYGSINFTNDNDGTVNQSNPLYYAKRFYQYDYSRRMWLPTMNLRASYAGSDGTIKGNTYIYAKCHTVEVISGVKTISHAAFRNCEMEELILPSSLEELGSYCFAGCTKLKRVSCAATTPPTVKANRPSFGSLDLSKVTLYVPSASVDAYKAHATWKKFDVKPIPTTVDTKTFGGITMQLKATSTASVVSFDASVLPPNVHIPDYIAYNGYTYPVTSIREFAFEKCDMSTIDLPTDISYIGSCAFKDCKNLVEVYMDKAVTTIDSNPFKGCISLQNVRITAETPPVAPNDWENTGNATLEVPPSSVSAYSTTTPWSGFSSTIELTGEHFWYKGIRYFLNYDGTASVTGFNEDEMDEDVTILSKLPMETTYTVTSIADKAFQSGYWDYDTKKWVYTSAGKIKSVTIPGTVKTIGEEAFYCCTSLKSVVLGDGIETIGRESFKKTGLISLNIPGSVKTINYSAFSDCSSLKSLTLNNGIETIGQSAFGSAKITKVDIPSSVKRIYFHAFRCSSLTNVTFHEGLEYLEESAFAYSAITSVTIPRSVKEIDGNPFPLCFDLASIQVESGNPYYNSNGNCNAIIETATKTFISGCKNTVIPEDVKIIGRKAFSGTSPEILVIPNQVTTIKEYATLNNHNLKTIIIGRNVSSIEKGNFTTGDIVTDVYSYAKTPPLLGSSGVFGHYVSNVTLHVPASSISLYRNADVWKNFGTIVALPDEGISTGVALPQDKTQSQDAWYTLDGRKLNGQPTKKGVYIHNGKTVIR